MKPKKWLNKPQEWYRRFVLVCKWANGQRFVENVAFKQECDNCLIFNEN